MGLLLFFILIIRLIFHRDHVRKVCSKSYRVCKSRFAEPLCFANLLVFATIHDKIIRHR